MQTRLLTLALTLLAAATTAQTTYFHQDFSQTTALVNPQPDTGQFSHVILTAPALSYHKFHKGYMELTRTRLDSATGGIIRALRATPFLPAPRTLIVRMTLSVEAIQSPAVNAAYWYIGEDFNPVNNSFPGNGLMFAKCALDFLENGFRIKDLETKQVSRDLPLKKPVTLTWVLNNSDQPLGYRIALTGTGQQALPGTYDLWVDDEPVALHSQAYPGTSVFSPTKLSNFEMRFRNGVGKIRMEEIRIDDGQSAGTFSTALITPNPARRDEIIVSGRGLHAARLVDRQGRTIPVRVLPDVQGRWKVRPLSALAAGVHILQLEGQHGEKQALKVMLE